MTPPAELVFVALGSNQGDSESIVRRAMDRLAEFAAGPVIKSSVRRTRPVDCPPGSEMFANALAAFAPLPGETPESLLAKLQALEKDFGRRPKKVLNEARPLDLDLIAFAGQTRNAPALTLPHPRARVRRFVLEPLSELAPDLILPGQTLNVAGLLAVLPPEAGLMQ